MHGQDGQDDQRNGKNEQKDDRNAVPGTGKLQDILAQVDPFSP